MSRCIFHRIQQGFDSDDHAALEQLLNTSSHVTVARIMTAAGYRMSEHTVRRHKRRDCMCEQVAA
jgi:hypothetical protein